MVPSPSGVSFSCWRKYGCMMRHDVEGARRAAFLVDAIRTIAAKLERKDARHIGPESQHLQIEHELDVIGKRIRHPLRRHRQFARIAAAVAFLDGLDTALDFSNVV